MHYNITKGETPWHFEEIMKLRSRIYLFVASFLVVLLVGALLLVRNANLLLKYKLEEALGKGFSVEKLEVNWRSVEALNAVYRKPDGIPVFKADHVFLSMDLRGALRKELNFSSVILKNPYLLIETDRRGNYINPFATERGKPSAVLPRITIDRFTVHNGSMDYSDAKVSRPPLVTGLKNIDIEVNDIRLPLHGTESPFVLEAAVTGSRSTGIIKSRGKINLKTSDLQCAVDIRGLDLTGFKAYFQRKSDANITGGTLDLDMKANISGGMIKAPGRAVLKNLEFQSTGGLKDTFLGVPRSAVMTFLKNRNGEIAIDFVLEGNLKNPRFNLRESFIQKFTVGLAETLGLSVTRIGESIIVEGARQIGKGAEGIGEEIQKIFK